MSAAELMVSRSLHDSGGSNTGECDLVWSNTPQEEGENRFNKLIQLPCVRGEDPWW